MMCDYVSGNVYQKDRKMSNEIIEHEPNSNQQPDHNFVSENEHRKYTFIVYGLYVASFFVLISWVSRSMRPNSPSFDISIL